jgi:hypothetical protein
MACHCGAPARGAGDYANVCDQWPLCETNSKSNKENDMEDPTFEITHVATHRNGVAGQPFTVAIIEQEGRRFLAIDFYNAGEPAFNGAFAALDLDQAAGGNIYAHPELDPNLDEIPGTGDNAWRGDQFSGLWRARMQRAAEEHSDEQLNYTIAKYKEQGQ